MKRFKTKRRISEKQKLFIFLSIIVFMAFFIWVSFFKLQTNYPKIVNYLFNSTSFNHYQHSSILKSLTVNLDNLIKTSSFKETKEVIYKPNNYQVYLYNTHDKETYQDKTSVFDANVRLSNNLKKLGIISLVEEKKPSGLLSTGLNYYNISRDLVVNTIKKYPDIKYYMDIHRDSVKDTTITINNKKYAKILFVLGLDNPKYQENKEIMEKMHNYLNNNYPGLSKGILEKSGKNVNGIYNQDIDRHVLLIEIGGIENNIEEVNNSTEIIALMMYHILGDKGEKNS